MVTRSGDAACFECEAIDFQEVQLCASEHAMFIVSNDTRIETEGPKYVRDDEILLHSPETASRAIEIEEKQCSCSTESCQHSLIPNRVVKEESPRTSEKDSGNLPSGFAWILGPLFLITLAVLIWSIFRAIQEAH